MHTKPYGSWASPITSSAIVAGTVGLEQPCFDGNDLYWIEGRPAEAGRNVVVRLRPDGSTADLTPKPFNARNRVHEYGGAAYTVHQGQVFFSNFSDQRLYAVRDGVPVPLTPEDQRRYADYVIDAPRGRLIGVCEDHSRGAHAVVNTIAAVSTAGGPARVLVEGHDFYSTPRLSADGRRLAWLAWDHPNMPWDGTELWVADVDNAGNLANPTRIAGNREEAVFQPEWGPDGTLYFVSDRTGWWNLYSWRAGKVTDLCPRAADFGRPQWVFGVPTYACVGSDRLICTYSDQGFWRVALLDVASRTLEELDCPYTEIGSIRASATQVVFTGGSPTAGLAVLRLDLKTGQYDVLKQASTLSFDSGYLSAAQAIEFPTEGGKTAHAFYYAPKNSDFTAPAGDKPPLLVRSHGGPTSATGSGLSLAIQFWTSRGFAVVDVNYGGSTGFGREYRRRLNDQWGIVDLDDCVNAARYLVEQGLADEQRVAIRGGSAGGYTTLAALTFRDFFRAGASYYGVSDLEALARETHKFESRYLDGLIGPYPERVDLYRARSPIHFTEKLSCPVILFQGLEDKVVPPNQAEQMVEALRQKGLPVAYVPFAGEQHGFRMAPNIKRALDAELYFYGKIFGFEPAEPIEPVPIDNL